MEFKPVSVLVIDNHPMMRASLCAAIAAEPDLDLLEPSAVDHSPIAIRFSNQEDVLFLSQEPEIILLRLGNSEQEDLSKLSYLRKNLPRTAILVLTSGEIPGLEQSVMRHGAHAVITLSASRSEIIEALRAVHPQANLYQSRSAKTELFNHRSSRHLNHRSLICINQKEKKTCLR